jgi:SanA protein
MKIKLKKVYKPTIIILTVLSLISILWANSTINKQTENKIFTETVSIPENNVGLLLGTSKILKNGKPNQYFENRISATVQLYKAGKIKNIVISGDNSRKDYNEPEDMKNELIKRGIPETQIYLDYAGFRTYDSVYRMKEIFGQDKFTIISQEFHNQRAVYIANALKIDAIGFNAKDVNAYNGFKTKVREKFARVKVFIDLIFDKKPKFLGEKIIINAGDLCEWEDLNLQSLTDSVVVEKVGKPLSEKIISIQKIKDLHPLYRPLVRFIPKGLDSVTIKEYYWEKTPHSMYVWFIKEKKDWVAIDGIKYDPDSVEF